MLSFGRLLTAGEQTFIRKEESMQVASYSVLKGRLMAGKVVTGASKHYQVSVVANGRRLRPR